jgi:hypothetical protein
MVMGEISPSLVPLRDRFIALNVARARDLVELADRIDMGQDAEASLLAIGEIVHKVAGVALTLGFPELGLRAAELDKIIIAFRGKEIALAAAWSQASPLMDALLPELLG